MAAEAVMKIREAEERGGALIREAQAEAKEIIKRAEAEGVKRKKAIIEQAHKQKAEVIGAAVKKAEADSKRLAGSGDNSRPSQAKLEKAAALIVERIVKNSGGS